MRSEEDDEGEGAEVEKKKTREEKTREEMEEEVGEGVESCSDSEFCIWGFTKEGGFGGEIKLTFLHECLCICL